MRTSAVGMIGTAVGSPHATDVAVVAPIVVDDRIFGFSGSIAHKSDIGGLVPGTNSGQAREIFHEGLMLPPVRYYRQFELVREVETILRANSRTPELVLGDLRGQVGATHLAAERVRAVCYYALKCLIDPELPSNSGFASAITASFRSGSLLDPIAPPPVNTYMPVAVATAEALFDALGKAIQGARIAESSSGTNGTLSHRVKGQATPKVQYELPARAIVGPGTTRMACPPPRSTWPTAASTPSRSWKLNSPCS